MRIAGKILDSHFRENPGKTANDATVKGEACMRVAFDISELFTEAV
jgi:hypothetical protein